MWNEGNHSGSGTIINNNNNVYLSSKQWCYNEHNMLQDSKSKKLAGCFNT